MPQNIMYFWRQICAVYTNICCRQRWPKYFLRSTFPAPWEHIVPGAVFADGHYETLLARHNIELTTLYWFYCTVYFYPHQYLTCLKSWKCSTRISRFIIYMLSLIKRSPPFSSWVQYLYLHLSLNIEMQSIMGTIVNCAILVDNRCRSSIALHLAERQVIRSQDSKGSEHYNMK